MRRQIEDLKRKADQGSQQLQGEAGEDQLEAILRNAFPMDDISGIGQGVRGADVHHFVVDSARGAARERFSGNARTRGTGATAGSRS